VSPQHYQKFLWEIWSDWDDAWRNLHI